MTTSSSARRAAVDQYLVGDCLIEMARIPAATVHLIVTSPPYNMGIDYGESSDDLTWPDYWRMLIGFIFASRRVLVPGGRMAVNLPAYAPGKRPGYAHHHRFAEAVRNQHGWILLIEIIWDQGYCRRTARGSFRSASAPRFPCPHEFILVHAKESGKRGDKKGPTDVTAEEFAEWSRPIWKVSGARSKDHPAVFPEEIPRRLIKMLSWPGDVVLDPFAGSGTTLRVARDLKRHWIGIDTNAGYKAAFEASRFANRE